MGRKQYKPHYQVNADGSFQRTDVLERYRDTFTELEQGVYVNTETGEIYDKFPSESGAVLDRFKRDLNALPKWYAEPIADLFDGAIENYGDTAIAKALQNMPNEVFDYLDKAKYATYEDSLNDFSSDFLNYLDTIVDMDEVERAYLEDIFDSAVGDYSGDIMAANFGKQVTEVYRAARRINKYEPRRKNNVEPSTYNPFRKKRRGKHK